MSRTYRMKERARRQQETRQRIVAAAVRLHATVGPAASSITAIAEEAGVTRPTVYAHFSDLASLFRACSAHSAASDPPPDLEGWGQRPDPEDRLRHALAELYSWYRRNRRMTANVLRDAADVPELYDTLEPMRRFQDAAVELLSRGWTRSSRRADLVETAIRHAIDFRAWESMAEAGASDDEAVRLATSMAIDAAGPR